MLEQSTTQRQAIGLKEFALKEKADTRNNKATISNSSVTPAFFRPAASLASQETPLLTNEQLKFSAKKFMEENNYQEAVKLYNRYLDQQPHDAEALSKRGCCFYELDLYDDALKDFNQSLALRAPHLETLQYRAATLHLLGFDKQALVDYDICLSRLPNNLDLRIERADTLGIKNSTFRN